MKVCLRTQVAIRRVQRHPVVKKVTIKGRHVVRNTAMGLVPNTLNDMVFHHSHLDIGEFFHITQDILMTNIIGTLVAITYKLL
jgi:hypothetical protein